LELGGKSPVIILPDADLTAAIPGAANAIFFNGGQVCIAGSRLYAHRSIHDRVVDGVAEAASGITLGHGLNPATHMGPLISKAHAAKVADYIAGGKADGASIICGGDTAGPNASFVLPTVVAGAKTSSRIVQEEIFGPVVVVTPFDDLDEVVDAANDSPYGLAAGIWSEGLSNATRLANRIRAGTIWINSHAMYDASLPIGGMKQSGFGRDSGQAALENYLELKTVCAVV
jgi:phenylacetaldehyde dehydrogenase